MLVRNAFFFVFLSFLFLAPKISAHDFTNDELAEAIRLRLETAQAYGQMRLGDEPVFCINTLPEFYVSRDFQPLWITTGDKYQKAKEMLSIIGDAEAEGLTPDDYHYARILTSLNHSIRHDSVGRFELIKLELLLSDAFFLYTSHLYYGKLNPETADPEWKAKRKTDSFDFAGYLTEAVESGKLREYTQMLAPRLPEYAVLKSFLDYYREVVARGGFPNVPAGDKLQRGDSSERIVAIKKRLYMGSNVEIKDGNMSPFFDDDLEAALKIFQRRNGLGADGVAGVKTVELLNVPAEKRIQDIKINMERLRWLPEDLGERYILVNLGSFELEIFDKASRTYDSEVIIGKTYRKTPIFSSKMTYLVLNPTWTVPPTILKSDILPEARKDPSVITRKGLKVLRSDGTEVPLADVDWPNVSSTNFPYMLRQPPGPTNALGDVKFMFPNPYSVYIHDTPSREMFNKSERAFSSGCIRLKNPLNMAAYLLAGTKYTREEIGKIVQTRVETTITLPKPLDVHILYLTAWVSESNSLRFGVDIYERDARIAKGLSGTPEGGSSIGSRL
ncbi:L,D-transpeptidase family protein [uncultured Imperialibacter sp.]|uniref:L,D-transpeptidase family protein n=1 Tax=uncultured Imperialibacter sp. TaxID=1672639 RepID=UPI0030DB597C